jgi:ubiquitin-like modifier-activating enzyme ATG7
MASELYISVTQHPQKSHAPPPSTNGVDPTFGSCPHQIRGHLSNWEQQCLSGLASQFCAGCGDRVVREWRERGEDFVKKVCERGGGKEVERVCGLEEVKKEFEAGWDGGNAEGEEDEWEL